MNIQLSVNLNKIALLRNSRNENMPSIQEFADYTVNCGVKSITVHPRPDERHITFSDIIELRKYKNIELNIEGNPNHKAQKNYIGWSNIIEKIQPEQCTFVPDSEGQLTSDHGWELKKHHNYLQEITQQLKEKTRVSIFIDANNKELHYLEKIKPHRVELYTGPYAVAFNTKQGKDELQKLYDTARVIQEMGIEINAGHGLNQKNLPAILSLPNLKEVSIGHSIVCESLIDGWKKTIQNYLNIIEHSQ